MSYIDDKFYVLSHTDRRTLLEQLAEEAAELSQAALKLIRAEKLSDNPTPANVSIASEQLNEELADVLWHLMAIARIVKGGDRIGYWQKNSENHERKRNVTKAIGYSFRNNRSCNQ